jgi:lysophospholipase L1-like esterase
MPTNSLLSPDAQFLIDFNLQMVPAALGLPVPTKAAAAMMDVDDAALADYIEQASQAVRRTAGQLLEKPAVGEAIDRWPVRVGSKLLMVGDSITTYRYGYARLLEALLALRRPADSIQVMNVAQSGYTSAHGLESTFTQFLALQPDWVFIKFGVNDCKQFGGPSARTLISLEEYRQNITAMAEAFRRYTSAQVVLLTPTPVIESVTNTLPDFHAMRMIWNNSNIAAFAENVRRIALAVGLPVVDLIDTFGMDPDPVLFLADGLHPGPAGHEIILEELLGVLAELR